MIDFYYMLYYCISVIYILLSYTDFDNSRQIHIFTTYKADSYK